MAERNVLLRDVLQNASCRPRIREKLEMLGIDVAEFLRSGTPIEQLEDIEDRHVQLAIAAAEERLKEEDTD